MVKNFLYIDKWCELQFSKELAKRISISQSGSYVDMETGEFIQPKKLPVRYNNRTNHDTYMRRKFGEWLNRLGFENQGRLSHFVTLTYNEWNYPDAQRIDHIQKFIKRVRRYMEYHHLSTSDGLPLRYFVSTERGKQVNRLHYHMVVFGLPRQIVDKLNNGIFAKNARNIWNYGFASVEKLTNNTIAYACKYIFKQWDGIEYKTLKNRNIGSSLMDDRNKELVSYFRRNMTTEIKSGLKHPFRLTSALKNMVFQRHSFDKRLDILIPFSNYVNISKVVKSSLWQRYKDTTVHPEFDDDSNGSYLECGVFNGVTLCNPISDTYFNSLTDGYK